MSTDDSPKDRKRGAGQPLALLFERPGLPKFELPAELVANYGGELGFDSPCVYANFAVSVDGVVSLPGPVESGQIISQNSHSDRFVMGLLRACADAVVLGAGTFRRASGHLWHAERIYPAAAALFAEARKRLGLPAHPTLVLVTASGDIDTNEPAIQHALIVTTPTGQFALRDRLPATARVKVVDSPTIVLADVIAMLRAEGARNVLTEGGPTLFTRLIAERQLDEIFVTSSPTLFGRFANDHRKSLVDGLDLAGTSLDLLSARRQGSHLFLRYAVVRPS